MTNVRNDFFKDYLDFKLSGRIFVSVTIKKKFMYLYKSIYICYQDDEVIDDDV